MHGLQSTEKYRQNGCSKKGGQTGTAQSWGAGVLKWLPQHPVGAAGVSSEERDVRPLLPKKPWPQQWSNSSIRQLFCRQRLEQSCVRNSRCSDRGLTGLLLSLAIFPLEWGRLVWSVCKKGLSRLPPSRLLLPSTASRGIRDQVLRGWQTLHTS